MSAPGINVIDLSRPSSSINITPRGYVWKHHSGQYYNRYSLDVPSLITYQLYTQDYLCHRDLSLSSRLAHAVVHTCSIIYPIFGGYLTTLSKLFPTD